MSMTKRAEIAAAIEAAEHYVRKYRRVSRIERKWATVPAEQVYRLCKGFLALAEMKAKETTK